MECSLCEFKTRDPIEFEQHLLEKHFLRYQDYCELELTHSKDPDSYCFKCGRYRNPLTTLMKDYYYLPCLSCFRESGKRIERQEMMNSILRNTKSYFDYLLGDRYLQLFLVDDIYPRSTYSHDYREFKKVLGKLELPSRNDIWFLDWLPGYPKIISISNLPGIKVVNLSKLYDIVSDKNQIIIGRYKILFPETALYEKQHFSRYNILNTKSDRRTKRIKVGESCYKLYKSSVKGSTSTIFRVVDSASGEPINLKEISYQDFTIIKLVLMRNKSYLRLVFSMIQELMKSVGTISDSVFLRNTIQSDPTKNLTLNISWLPEPKNEEKKENDIYTINISIL